MWEETAKKMEAAVISHRRVSTASLNRQHFNTGLLESRSATELGGLVVGRDGTVSVVPPPPVTALWAVGVTSLTRKARCCQW